MPDPRRVWMADEIVKLKAMAGKEPGERIAAELGRTLAAIQTEASKLGLSLRTKRRSRSTQTVDGHQREAFLNFPANKDCDQSWITPQ